MKRTTPLLFIVTGLSIALLALAIFWLALLPVKLASAMKGEIEKRTGMKVRASGSGLTFQNGLSMRLDNVTLVSGAEQSAPSASIDHVTAGLSLANVFGGKLRLESLDLDSPTINIKTEGKPPPSTDSGSGLAGSVEDKPFRNLTLTLHNGTLKWSDGSRQFSYAVSDLNGTVTTEHDGNAKIDLSGLFNGKLTRLAATVDDVRRLKTDGSPSDVTLSAGASSISFSGRSQFRDGIQMAGRLSASSDSLRNLGDWFGLQFAGFGKSGKVQAESSLSWDGARLELKQLAVALGSSNITGSASLDLKQARPMLEAKLQGDHIDLSLYGKGDGPATQPETPSITAPWNESPKDFRDLRALDADVKLAAAKLSVAGLEIGKTEMQLHLKDAALALTLASDDVVGGKANAELHIIQNDNMPEVSLKLDAQNVLAKKFLQPLTGFSALDGPMSLQADLTTKGDSTARLISSLGGTAHLTLERGSINGLALVELLAVKGKGWHLASDKATVLTSADARFEIQDGVAQIASAEATSNGLKISAEGEIDLLRQNLDLVCKPTVEGAVKLPVQLAVTGPWTDPDVTADIDPAKLKPKALLKTGKKAIKKLFGN